MTGRQAPQQGRLIPLTLLSALGHDSRRARLTRTLHTAGECRCRGQSVLTVI